MTWFFYFCKRDRLIKWRDSKWVKNLFISLNDDILSICHIRVVKYKYRNKNTRSRFWNASRWSDASVNNGKTLEKAAFLFLWTIRLFSPLRAKCLHYNICWPLKSDNEIACEIKLPLDTHSRLAKLREMCVKCGELRRVFFLLLLPT